MSTMYRPEGAVGLGVAWSVLDEAHRSVTLSSLSSLSAIPAPPVPDQETDALLVALNEWDAPGSAYTVRVQQGGHVGPASATWAWKDATEADTSYRGHAWPNYARRCWCANGRTGETGGSSDMVTLPSGRVVIVHGVIESGASREIRGLWIESEAIGGGTAGSEIMILTEDPAHAKYEGWRITSALGYPTVAYWEEQNRLICAVRYLFAAASLGQVALFESTDEGATWTLRNPRALREPWVDTLRGSYGNLILRRVGGSWMLLDEYVLSATTVPTIAQYAGTTPDHLQLLEEGPLAGDDFDSVIEIQVASDGNGAVLVGVAYDTGGPSREDVRSWRIGSAWMPLSEAQVVAITDSVGGSVAGFYPCAAFDPDGTLWAAYLDEERDRMYLAYSLDRGDTWLTAGYDPLETDAAAPMNNLSMTTYRGGMLVGVRADNGGSWHEDIQNRGLFWAFGGWDNDPLPYVPTNNGSQGRIGYGARYSSGFTWGVDDNNCLSWFPPVLITTPTPSGALTGAAPTLIFPDGDEPYLVFADAGAGSYVTWTPTSIPYTTGVIVETDFKVDAIGTSVLADNRIMDVRLPDVGGGGANTIHVSVRVDATQVVLYNEHAGAALSTIAIAGTTQRKYRLAVANTRVSLSYKAPGDQVWTRVTATTTTAASVAVERIRAGAVTTNGQSLRFYSFEFVGQVGPQGTHDPTRAISAAYILGRPASPSGVPVYLGYQLAWRRGPLHPGHTWTTTSTAKFPPALVGPRDYPSPSDQWRSSTDNVQFDYVWEPAGGQLWRPPGSVYFMLVWADGLEGLTLAGRDSTGTYQTLITATPGSGLSTLRYSAPVTGGVTGGSLRPDSTGNAADRAFREGELIGGWVRIATSGAAYRIIGNTPGFWGPSGSYKPTIYVEDWDGAEPDAGVFSIIPPVSLHVVPEMNPATGYDRFRLRLPATANTVEGGYRVKAVIGSVFIPGRPYSYGRTPSVEPVARGVETAGGRSFYDPEQPIRRFARFAWTDPYGTPGLHNFSASTGPNALLLASAGTQAVALVDQAHRDLEGVLRLQGGPGRTLVYLPRVEPQLTAWMSSDPDRWLYGRIVNALTTPRPHGDEGAHEEVTVSEIVFQEEV